MQPVPRQGIEDEVERIVYETTAMIFEVEPSDIRADHDLQIDLGATSMTIMDLGVALERRLDIKFTAIDFVDGKSVGQLVSLVRRRMAEKP